LVKPSNRSQEKCSQDIHSEAVTTNVRQIVFKFSVKVIQHALNRKFRAAGPAAKTNRPSGLFDEKGLPANRAFGNFGINHQAPSGIFFAFICLSS
jgi:hypothetical protein